MDTRTTHTAIAREVTLDNSNDLISLIVDLRYRHTNKDSVKL